MPNVCVRGTITTFLPCINYSPNYYITILIIKGAIAPFYPYVTLPLALYEALDVENVIGSSYYQFFQIYFFNISNKKIIQSII
jgi:hypothetical protein